MSGHSKWSTIKRQKGATDAKRGQTFTKLSNAITMAVKQGGGGNPEQNFRLRLAIERARTVNMPKDNIERAIEKGLGKDKGDSMEEVVYEGFALSGIAVIVEAVTDNRLRTNSEIRNVFDRNGGTIGTPGSVAYQFVLKGLITVNKNGKNLDDIFLLAADCGAEDVEDAEEEVYIYTKPDELTTVKDKLTEIGLQVVEVEFTRKPMTTVQIQDVDVAQKLLSFLEKLENMDDVHKVYTNFELIEIDNK